MSEDNPSMQCSVCGQWKRLTYKSGTNENMQRFYPCCGDHGEWEHLKPVCDECCKDRCPYRFKDMLVIFSEHAIAPDHMPKGFWTSTLNGELQDYNPKKQLIAMAEEKGIGWVVIKKIANDYPKIIQQSQNN